MKKFKLYAEWEIRMEEMVGEYDTMEEAAAWIEKNDNLELYIGAEMVLVDNETKEKWLYTDTWEKLEDEEA